MAVETCLLEPCRGTLGTRFMELYLLRHGTAERFATTGDDATRRLTEEGRTQVRRVLERAHAAGARASLILTSPYRRALETAEIAAHELGYEGKLVRSAVLTPDASPAQVWEEIRVHHIESSIVLCGHEPLFSATVAHLLGSARAMVHYPTGVLMRVDVSAFGAAPAGVLQWMLTPGTA